MLHDHTFRRQLVKHRQDIVYVPLIMSIVYDQNSFNQVSYVKQYQNSDQVKKLYLFHHYYII